MLFQRLCLNYRIFGSFVTAVRVSHFTQHICSATKAACTTNLGQTSSPSLNQGTASSSTASVYAGFLTGNSQVISSSSSNGFGKKVQNDIDIIYI